MFQTGAVLRDSRQVATYAALRATTGPELRITVTTLGIAGDFFRDDTDTTSADSAVCLVRGDGVRFKRQVESDILLSWFGVKASASAAVNNAAIAAFQVYVASRLVTSTERAEKNGAVVGVLPDGELKFSADRFLFDPANFASPSVGALAYRGAGLYRTTVIWQPAATGYKAIDNNNKTLDIELSDIGFTCNDATATFMLSTRGSLAVQGLRARRCYWTGTWKRGTDLVGSNNNSEHFYDTCGFYGTWEAWQFAAASGTSDQFLNYNYHDCKYWSSSPWVDMAVGGAVRIRDCDVSGYAPAASAYLFNLRGFAHANGVCSFYVTNTRMELRNLNAHVLYCEWPDGIVSIDGLDTQSQAGVASMASAEHFVMVPGNNPGPLLKVANSQLIGKARFITYGGAALYANRFSFDNVSFYNQARFTDYFVFDTGSASGNLGGVPHISIKRSRCAPGTLVVSDADLNWNQSTAGLTLPMKWIPFSLGTGKRPYAGSPVTLPALPIGARLRKLLLVAENGHCADGFARTMTLKSNGVTIGSYLTPGTYGAGFDTEVAVSLLCDTAAKAETIELSSDATGQTTTATMLLGYLG